MNLEFLPERPCSKSKRELKQLKTEVVIMGIHFSCFQLGLHDLVHINEIDGLSLFFRDVPVCHARHSDYSAHVFACFSSLELNPLSRLYSLEVVLD